jgi:hypothetical protein
MANDPVTVLNKIMDAGPDYVRLKVGTASITLKADGSIELSGSRVNIIPGTVKIEPKNDLLIDSDRITIFSGGTLQLSAGANIRIDTGEFNIEDTGNADLHCRGAMTIRADRDLRLQSKGRPLTTTAHQPAHGVQPAGTGNTW